MCAYIYVQFLKLSTPIHCLFVCNSSTHTPTHTHHTHTQVGDEASILPTKLFQYLEHSLSSSVVTTEYLKRGATSTSRADDIVVNTFMTFFAYLFGNYKMHLKATSKGKEFQRSEFIETFSSKSTKRVSKWTCNMVVIGILLAICMLVQFLEAFQMTQMFENFLEQRENPAKEDTTAQSMSF